jgi:hypothetical protein
MFSANKIPAALSILLFFVLAVLIVSFASRTSSTVRLPRYVNSHHSLKDEIAQLDTKTLRTAMLIEEDGELPKLSQNSLIVDKPAGTLFKDSRINFIVRTIFAPKVSTNILQSVLNL